MPTADDQRRRVTKLLSDLEELAGDGFLSPLIVRLLQRARKADCEPVVLGAEERGEHQDSDRLRIRLGPPAEWVDVLPARTAKRIDIEMAVDKLMTSEIEPALVALKARWNQGLRAIKRQADEQEHGATSGDPFAVDAAAVWLRQYLAGRPDGVLAREVKEAAEAAGHAWRLVKDEAKRKAGAVSRRAGRPWKWELR